MIHRIIYIIILFTALMNASIGMATAVSGRVKIERGGAVKRIGTGFQINRGDTIVTGRKSRVQVTLNDDTVITLGSNTKYSINDYLYNNKKDSKLNMTINKGFFKVVSGKIGKISPDRFKLKTRVATIGIRGTVFNGFVKKGYEWVFCSSGKIYLDTVKHGRIFVNRGNRAVFSKGKWRVFAVSGRKNSKKQTLKKKRHDGIRERQRSRMQETELHTGPHRFHTQELWN